MHTFSKVIAISALAFSLVACGDNLSGEDRLATLVATAQIATMTAQVPTDIAATATAAAEANAMLTQTAMIISMPATATDVPRLNQIIPNP